MRGKPMRPAVRLSTRMHSKEWKKLGPAFVIDQHENWVDLDFPLAEQIEIRNGTWTVKQVPQDAIPMLTIDPAA